MYIGHVGAALAAKRKRGERASRIVPYGFRLAAGGSLVEPDAAEQGTLMMISELRAAGKSLRDVAAELNARGIRTRSGGCWRFEFVRSLVRRQRSAA